MNFYTKIGRIVEQYEKLLDGEAEVSRIHSEQPSVRFKIRGRKVVYDFEMPKSFEVTSLAGKVKVRNRQYILGGNAPAQLEFIGMTELSKVELAKAMGFGVIEPCPQTRARWAIASPGVCKLFKLPYSSEDPISIWADAFNKVRASVNQADPKAWSLHPAPPEQAPDFGIDTYRSDHETDAASYLLSQLSTKLIPKG